MIEREIENVYSIPPTVFAMQHHEQHIVTISLGKGYETHAGIGCVTCLETKSAIVATDKRVLVI